MSRISFSIETKTSRSLRAQQVSSMFDAPSGEKCSRSFDIEFPWDDEPWNVGLVVGPSGSGKSSVLRHVWGESPALDWLSASMIDDFSDRLSIEEISKACGSVGFNTVPAWMRPFAVLSNGEKFRADIARRLLEDRDPIVIDEFSSVVDRQVAQIASHAIQKFVREQKRKFVAVGCHYDVIDWLQPDWVLDMATCNFQRRLLQRRPEVRCTIARLPRAAWSVFSQYHYMTADMPPATHGFGLWANGTLACGAWLAVFPHPKAKDIVRVARIVTLPDWQGLGLAFTLLNALGSALKAGARRLRNYPAHPAFIEAHKRKGHLWNSVSDQAFSSSSKKGFGDRCTAVFEYCGSSNPRFATLLGLQRKLAAGDEVEVEVGNSVMAESTNVDHGIHASTSPTERDASCIHMGAGSYAVVPVNGHGREDRFIAGGVNVDDTGMLVVLDEDGTTIRRVYARGTWRDIRLVAPRGALARGLEDAGRPIRLVSPR